MSADEAIATINAALCTDLVRTVKGDELKGWVQAADGATKFYVSAAECRACAEAFAFLAAALEVQS